jgi:aspartyl-tRNA synthetase
MVSGFDRYYQFARCYRDEDFRADRQPEFTQLDLEASFVTSDDIMGLTEDILTGVWKTAGFEIKTPFDRISYKDAMDKYGSDKPELRISNELVELTDYFKDTPFRVFQAEYVGAIVFKGGAATPRREFDKWQEWAKTRGAKGLAYVSATEEGLTGPVAKNLSDAERDGLLKATGAEVGDAIFFAAGERESSQTLLGAARVEIATRQGLLKPDKFAFCWVTDFPMFKKAAGAKAEGDVTLGQGEWTAVHHAFTAPTPESLDTFDKDPENAMSDAYDIVCNGAEIGGGSIRIHNPEVQKRVFAVMGISDEEAQEKFGFLLDAFKFGAPPHGGLALGWDRVISILGGKESIRDVIAFPKSGGGVDTLTGAPSAISDEQRAETGVDWTPEDE